MNSFNDLSVAQLKRLITLREQIDALQAELGSILGGAGAAGPVVAAKGGRGGRRGITSAGRAAIAAAQRVRWAKAKGMKPVESKPAGKRKMSAAGRAAIAAGAKKRWAAFRAAKRKA
jgi:hypothetical protein